MHHNHYTQWQFIGVLIALPLQFAATILFALAFSVPGWSGLQTAMLVLLPTLVAVTALLGALSLRRIGKPLNWAFSTFLFPPLPALIYAVACRAPAPAVRRSSSALAEMEPAR
jgi:hypothetical protein